jgi:hypothetical protein
MNNLEILQDILIISTVFIAGFGSVAFLFWLLFKKGVPPYEQLNKKLNNEVNHYKTYKYKKVNSL